SDNGSLSCHSPADGHNVFVGLRAILQMNGSADSHQVSMNLSIDCYVAADSDDLSVQVSFYDHAAADAVDGVGVRTVFDSHGPEIRILFHRFGTRGNWKHGKSPKQCEAGNKAHMRRNIVCYGDQLSCRQLQMHRVTSRPERQTGPKIDQPEQFADNIQCVARRSPPM